MTVTIVPANANFFVIHAHPGETEYNVVRQVSIIAWRIEDETRMLPEPITPEGLCRRNSDCGPCAVLHPNGLVTSLSGRVVERTYPNDRSWLEDCCTPEERATFDRRKMESSRPLRP